MLVKCWHEGNLGYELWGVGVSCGVPRFKKEGLYGVT